VHERGWTDLTALPLFTPAGFRAEAVTSAADYNGESDLDWLPDFVLLVVVCGGVP